jgi:hypothetical protein
MFGASQSRAARLPYLLVVTMVLLVTLTAPGAAAGSGPPHTVVGYGDWEPFIGTDLTTPAIPDYNANYFTFAFTRTDEAKYVGLRFKGEFGYARYMSFNIYRAHQSPSYGALTDAQLPPAPGSVNPFLPGTAPNAGNRSYVVAVQPAGYAKDPQENTLEFDPLQISTLVVMVRYYVPQGSATAGVPLPTIEAYDARTGQSVALPEQYLLGGRSLALYAWIMRPIFTTIVDNKLRFYHSEGAGLFPNADNRYLIGAVTRRRGEVVVLRVKPPTFPEDPSEYGSTQVRYWSLNEGNRDTSTPLGLRDDQFKVASDGFVYVAIGDKGIRRQAEKRGYKFVPWVIRGQTGTVIYRNLVTDPSYAGSIDKVPLLDLSDPQNIYAQNAARCIGDHAPTGVTVSLRRFLKDGGGIAPPQR